MSYNVITIPQFDKDLKRLSKKYPSIKKDLSALVDQIADNPKTGNKIIDNCYKIRMTISSKGKGKSAGARVITYVITTDETIFLLSIYDKSEQASITDKEIAELVRSIDL